MSIEAMKQEPVAWMYVNTDGECEQIEYIKDWPMPNDPSITPLYTAPRQWQGLTDEDLSVCDDDGVILARYWEAKLKEKNT